MASHNLLPTLLTLLLSLRTRAFAPEISTEEKGKYPFACDGHAKKCNASLYHINKGLQMEQVAYFYSVNLTQISPTLHRNTQDYLVTVPCYCETVNGTTGYFYDAPYTVRENDTFQNVSNQIYSGQAWEVGDEEDTFKKGNKVPMHLLCGCIEIDSQIVVTYSVQKQDTLLDIASRLSSTTSGILSMNGFMNGDPSFIKEDWVLYIPKEINGIPTSPSKIDGTALESEKPVIYTAEEIEEATNNFDETRKIGAGGHGSVYFGVIGGQEVAIKKMRSIKSKEFLSEVKILCRVHHINVVELLGYASGDDHLYLVYEYIQNGSLSDHLHDPLLKGYQPLSWTARTQIALDAAKGIEYIHDHTKKRYVHRDIKSSNILLDEGLRAKVTTKTDVFAFGVVLAELITGQRALVHDNWEPNKMRSLITVVYKIFEDEDPESALENVVDRNLQGSFPMDYVYKMAEIADWCLSENPVNRPEMRDIVPTLSKIMSSSEEWEASLAGNSTVFSGIYNGR
ncbi:hypothetical protein GH714_023877 [Hevea brasiliensis]|uniref:Protein kinase domain-containing protein n=1 Tax=Hevea brasiliensis TaxID=3981 RepID=A0A6A6KF63_HEVBR|nr:hypothetical protein GH714_023877 [Hevea brasiliensis]